VLQKNAYAFFVTLSEKKEQDKKTTNHTTAGVLVFLKKLSLKKNTYFAT